MKIKKSHKKFSENNFYSKAKIFQKKFLQKSRNDSVAAGRGKGGGGLLWLKISNTSAKRTYRIYIGRFVVYKYTHNSGNGVFLPLFVRGAAALFFLMV